MKLGIFETTQREPVRAMVAGGREHGGRIQVQITGVRAIRTRRPVVAAVSLIVDRSRRIVIMETS
ncbi:MAG: hypothetical protein LBG59_08425 [Candidatus Peribacteria bacterium]|nr:hypothetical protein [Candidatus Peribacteria bacterium]